MIAFFTWLMTVPLAVIMLVAGFVFFCIFYGRDWQLRGRAAHKAAMLRILPSLFIGILGVFVLNLGESMPGIILFIIQIVLTLVIIIGLVADGFAVHDFEIGRRDTTPGSKKAREFEKV